LYYTIWLTGQLAQPTNCMICNSIPRFPLPI